MKTRKMILSIGIVLMATVAVSGCSITKKKNIDQNNQTKQTEQVSKDDEKNAEKAAEIVLNAVLKKDSTKFKKVTQNNETYDDFIQENIEKQITKARKEYTPVELFSFDDGMGKVYTPSDVVEDAYKTDVYDVFPKINDYTIESVEIDDSNETALITFSSKAIDTNKMADAVRQINEEITDTGLQDSYISGKISDEQYKKAYNLYFNYLKYLMFSEFKENIGNHVDFLTSNDVTTTLELEKDANGKYIINTDNFTQLKSDLFVDDSSSNDRQKQKDSDDNENDDYYYDDEDLSESIDKNTSM